jgi:hypothetical protein
MGPLEDLARDVTGDPKATLGEVLKRNPSLLPKPLDTALSQVWGCASNEARHVEEGREPGCDEGASRWTRRRRQHLPHPKTYQLARGSHEHADFYPRSLGADNIVESRNIDNASIPLHLACVEHPCGTTRVLV